MKLWFVTPGEIPHAELEMDEESEGSPAVETPPQRPKPPAR